MRLPCVQNRPQASCTHTAEDAAVDRYAVCKYGLTQSPPAGGRTNIRPTRRIACPNRAGRSCRVCLHSLVFLIQYASLSCQKRLAGHHRSPPAASRACGRKSTRARFTHDLKQNCGHSSPRASTGPTSSGLPALCTCTRLLKAASHETPHTPTATITTRSRSVSDSSQLVETTNSG